MVRPRSWEHGFGTVRALCPTAEHLVALRAGALSFGAYRAAFEDKLARAMAGDLAPGRLRGVLTETSGHVDNWQPVKDGDTLCCACSRLEASLGRCHRAWCAPALVRNGWRVVLDGVVLPVPAAAP